MTNLEANKAMTEYVKARQIKSILLRVVKSTRTMERTIALSEIEQMDGIYLFVYGEPAFYASGRVWSEEPAFMGAPQLEEAITHSENKAG